MPAQLADLPNYPSMPTYVYECSSCEKQFEIHQRITENALDTCICGSQGTVKRVIQPIAVVFKGSGFHINDYAGSGAKPESKAESVEATTEAKTESTPTAPAAEATASPTPPPSAPAADKTP